MVPAMQANLTQTVTLEHDRLLAMLDAQVESVEKRFPGRGLVDVAKQVREAAAHAPALCDHILKPNLLIRVSVAILGAAIVVGLVVKMSTLDFGNADGWAVLEGLEAAINTAVYMGIAIFFLVSYETRRRRERALTALQELRALAHVLDMHQLNKDPERLVFLEQAKEDDEKTSMSPFLLERYLDYTADLLAMVGKLAAWYAQRITDPEVLLAVTELEQLTGSLSLKIWQKIQIVNQVYERSAN